MELINCKLLIELTDSGTEFGDSWSFSIDRFSFVKINTKSVEVTFSYSQVTDSPSEWDKEYIETEEKLQRILDLICLETSGIAMRVVEDSQHFTYRTGSSSTTTPTHTVEVSNLADIEERYKRLNDVDDDKLADAL